MEGVGRGRGDVVGRPRDGVYDDVAGLMGWMNGVARHADLVFSDELLALERAAGEVGVGEGGGGGAFVREKAACVARVCYEFGEPLGGGD